jgi:hypothetical protein
MIVSKSGIALLAGALVAGVMVAPAFAGFQVPPDTQQPPNEIPVGGLGGTSGQSQSQDGQSQTQSQLGQSQTQSQGAAQAAAVEVVEERDRVAGVRSIPLASTGSDLALLVLAGLVSVGVGLAALRVRGRSSARTSG